VEILAQSSTAFVLTHNFQGTHILGASRGHLSYSVASCLVFIFAVSVVEIVEANQQINVVFCGDSIL